MSNIGQPASGAGILYWNGSVLRWSGAPSTGDVPYWDGSSIDWQAAPASLTGYTDSGYYYMTAVGYDTAPDSNSSYYGSYFGYQAGKNSGSTSDYSTHLGANAGYYMTGSYNLAIGYKSGNDYSSGQYNILAGLNANLGSSSDTYSIVIGVGTISTPFYGKGSYSTRIGDLNINDVWIAGDTFHFGDETATGDKYWYFTRSSAASGHPGFKWNETDDQIEWSNDGSSWTALGGGSLVGITNDSSGTPYPVALTSLGVEAGDSLSTSYQVYTGYITAIGMRAATAHTVNGYQGTFVGYRAGGGQTTGRYGTFIGANAGYYGVGDNCTVVGYNALYGGSGSVVADCTAVGSNAGWSHSIGDHCTYFGSYAGYANYDAEDNTMIGSQAGRYIRNYDDNTIVGAHAMAGGAEKVQACTVIGAYAGSNMTSTSLVYSEHVLIGYNAGLGLGISSNNEGGTVAIGTDTGWGYQDGGCVFIGADAGRGYGAVTVGAWTNGRQVYVGYNAGSYGQSGSSNVGVGNLALYGQSGGGSGGSNAAVGNAAGQKVTDGSYNALFGYQCGDTIETGDSNVCVGNDSDVAAVDSSNVIAIGDGCAGPTNSIAIGDTVVLTNSNSGMISPSVPTSSAVPAAYFWIGDSTASLTVQAGAFTPHSDVRIKKNIEDLPYGLKFVLGLRPRLYDLKTPSTGANKRKHMGFIAQELKEDTKKKGLDGSLIADDNPDGWAVDYNQLVAPLVKGMQELFIQVDELKKELAELKAKG